jgi:hypothetical protein
MNSANHWVAQLMNPNKQRVGHIQITSLFWNATGI